MLKLNLSKAYLIWKICKADNSVIVILSTQSLFHSLVSFFAFLRYITVLILETYSINGKGPKNVKK